MFIYENIVVKSFFCRIQFCQFILEIQVTKYYHNIIEKKKRLFLSQSLFDLFKSVVQKINFAW